MNHLDHVSCQAMWHSGKNGVPIYADGDSIDCSYWNDPIQAKSLHHTSKQSFLWLKNVPVVLHNLQVTV